MREMSANRWWCYWAGRSAVGGVAVSGCCATEANGAVVLWVGQWCSGQSGRVASGPSPGREPRSHCLSAVQHHAGGVSGGEEVFI